MNILKPVFVLVTLLIIWQLIIILSDVPPYILPPPFSVIEAAVAHADIIFNHATITFIEMVVGLVIGTLLGSSSALVLSYYRPARQWLMPILVISQAIPVFCTCTNFSLVARLRNDFKNSNGSSHNLLSGDSCFF